MPERAGDGGGASLIGASCRDAVRLEIVEVADEAAGPASFGAATSCAVALYVHRRHAKMQQVFFALMLLLFKMNR